MAKSESLPIAQIYVPVKRKGTFDPNLVREIAESMLEIGQQAPVLVRRDGGRFVLVDGLHRLEACKALGEETILALLVSAQARQQKDLSPYEAEAETLRQKTAGLKQLRLAKEAAERSASAAAVKSLEEATAIRPRDKANRSSDKSSRSKEATLSEWLADREQRGFRT